MSNKFLPKVPNWFRLPDYVRNIFQASVDNSASNLLALDSEGNPVLVDKSTIGGGSGGGNDLKFAEFTLTDTDLTQATMLEVIPAPGAGKVIIPVTAVFSSNLSVAFSNPGFEAMILGWGSSKAADANIFEIFDFVLETVGGFFNTRGAAADFLTRDFVAQFDPRNQPLNLYLSNNAGGSFTGGVGTLKITISYLEIEF